MTSYSQKRTSRKVFFFFSTLIALALALFLFRQTLLAYGVKSALNALMPGHRLTYQELRWQGNQLILTGVHRADEGLEATLDRAEIDFEWHLKAPFIVAKMKLIHPQINLRRDKLLESTTLSPAAVLFPSKFYTIKLDVQNGVVQLGTERFYFAFTGGEKEGKIGTLFVSYDPSLLSMPFLLIDLQKEEEEFISEIKVEQTSCSKLVQLAQLFYPEMGQGWQKVEGEIEAQVKAILQPSGALAQMSCHFDVVDLALFNSQLGVQARAEHFRGQFQYPAIEKEEKTLPFWKQILATLSLQKGECLLTKEKEEWGFSEIEGDIALDPNQDPSLFVKGLFRHKETQVPWQIDGKGSVHEDQSFWLELALQMDSASEGPSQGFLSLCSPENGAYVIQAEAKKIAATHLVMAQQLLASSFPVFKECQVCSGTLKGKAVGWVENNHFARLEWDACEGEGICLLFPEKGAQGYIDLFKSAGHLNLSKSSLKGELQCDIALATDQLFGLIEQKWGKIFQENGLLERTSLATWVKIKEEGSEFSGTLAFGHAEGEKEQVQFGFISNTLFPRGLEGLSSGWVRAPKLTSSFYAPFMAALTPHLSLEGTVDLFGTFDHNGMECSIQIEEPYLASSHFELKAPSIGEYDPLLLKTEGRAAVRYDAKTAEWKCKVPLKKATLFEAGSEATFENVAGEFSFLSSGEKWKGEGQITHADLNINSSLRLENMRTEFVFDSQNLSLQNTTCAIPISWGSTYICRAPRLHLTLGKGWDFHIQLVDLAELQGTAKEDFSQAQAQIECMKQIIDAEMEWNRAENLLSLVAKGKGFQLEAKKKDESYAIEKLRWNNLFLRALFKQKETELSFSLLELKGDDFFARSSGTAQIHLPTEAAPLTLQAELDLALEVHQPLPIQAQNTGKVRVAYTPGFGIVLSGLNLEEGKSSCAIEFLEFFPGEGKWTAQGVQFSLSEQFLKQFENKPLFALLEKPIEKEKGIKGAGNLSFANKTLKAELLLKSLAYWNAVSDLAAQIELQEQGLCKISLRDATKKGGLVALLEGTDLKRLSGNLAGLNLDLTRLPEQSNVLTGTIGIDVSELFMLLPHEAQERLIKLQVAGEYRLAGDFHLGDNWKFDGKVQAKEFELMGYEFAFLECEALFQNREILLQNVVIDDDAGTLSAKQVKCFKETARSPWAFFIPAISIQELRPSLLNKLDVAKRIKKPLIIKNANLFDCRGYLDSPSTYAAKGTMNFTNAFKKEFSLFDIPLDMLKNLGLDPNLFTPVVGEVDYELKAGKFYITSLRNTFSESKRSQFYLEAPTVSYLDLDGNLHLDIRLKQNVALRIADSLTLSVRGTWERPKYSLQ